jgi:Protein of unknown function (DUF1553)/Protein of unknown function (DUF1549)/Planctomycete cytochrome C
MYRSPHRTMFNHSTFCIVQRMRWLCSPVAALALICQASFAVEPDEYVRQIKPILTEKCISCHGALRSEAGLRLDAIQLIRAGSESGSIVTSEKGGVSKLIERVTSDDCSRRMPPEEAGTALTKEQLQLFTSWIDVKAPGPEHESFLESPREHWAYQPIKRPELPSSPDQDSLNPIDRLIRAVQRNEDVRSLDSATDLVWIRRATFDVTGLPPTYEDLHHFMNDPSENKRLVAIDKLLSKASYGERWGRHWMDVWRYSDWDGYKNELRSSQRHIWHWRDWIVESLNANKPYDQMIVEMLAADEHTPTNSDALRATGFLARNFHKSNRNIWLDATVEHTAKAFLGLTLNCAKCHDHKYDPIPQTAYYQFRAIFEPHRIRTDQIAGVANIENDGIPRAYDEDLKAATYLYVRGNDENPLKDSPMSPSVPDFFQIPMEIAPVKLPLESYYPELSDVVRENTLSGKKNSEKTAHAKLRAKIDQAEKARMNDASNLNSIQGEQKMMSEIEFASSELKLAMADHTATRARYAAETAKYASLPDCDEGHQLAKDASLAEFWYKRAQAAHDLLLKQRDYNAAVALPANESDSAKRAASMKTAEEALKKSQGNFDKLPLRPDENSTDYTPIGKVLPRQSSGRRLALAEWIVHPDNPLTARVAINHIWLRHFGTPLVDNTFDFGISSPKPELLDVLNWLAAELISSGWDMKQIHRLILSSDIYAAASDDRDIALYQSNMARDPENRTLWRSNVRRLDAEEIRDSLLAVSGMLDEKLSGPDIDFADGEKVMRRSLYFRHAYEKQMPMLVLFDSASPNECYRRKPSLVPQQALALANSGLARRMAKQLVDECMEADEHQFIDRLFMTTLARPASPEEMRTCVGFLESQSKLLSDPFRLTRFAENAKTKEADDNRSPAERAAQSLAIVLFNHHDFVSIR